MRKFKHIAWFALLILVACTQDDIPTINEDASAFDASIETAKDVEIIYSDSAVVRVRIEGPTMLYHVDAREPKQEFTDGVKVDFFDAAGNVTSVLTGRYGIRHESEGEVIVRDSVVWQSIKGEKLETEELIWDEREQRVYNHKFVVVTRPDEVIMGHGFEATQDFKQAKVNAVTGRMRVEDLGKEIE
jgi:LPS export ABC transporter protein LptC